jgi:NAD(P)H-hydrate repair Nnr-like enzyme with NAD(P)H-hydrate dehydratase domain
VLPVLRTSQENTNGTSPIEIANNIAEKMKPLHSLVIGPGLGRDDCVQETAKRIIEIARAMSLPLIIDGVRLIN